MAPGRGCVEDQPQKRADLPDASGMKRQCWIAGHFRDWPAAQLRPADGRIRKTICWIEISPAATIGASNAMNLSKLSS
jgi:hypothetical protein